MKAKPVNLKAIIFDCDGVILDSEYLFTQSMINYLTTQNVIVTLEDVKRYIGIPLDGIINMMIKDFSLRVSYDDIETYFNETDQVMNYPYKLTPMPGLIDFVKMAHNKGITLAIGSSSPADYVNTIIENFGIKKYFSLVLTISEVPNGKPAPDIYNAITAKLGLNNDSTVIIEDSATGIKAGKAAGIYTIGYKGSKIEQNTSNADISAFSYKEITEILKLEEN